MNPLPTDGRAQQFADDRVVRVSHVGAIRTMQVLTVALLVTVWRLLVLVYPRRLTARFLPFAAGALILSAIAAVSPESVSATSSGVPSFATSLITSSPTSSISALATSGSTLYYASESGVSSKVLAYNPSTKKTKVLMSTGLVSPTSLFATPADLFVNDEFNGPAGNGSLLVYSLVTRRTSIVSDPSIVNPTQVVANATTAWVLCPSGGPDNSGSVSSVDLATSKATEVDSPTLSSPTAMTLSASDLYVANATGGPSGIGSVSDVNIASATVSIFTSPQITNPTSLALQGDYLWVGLSSGGTYLDGSVLRLTLSTSATVDDSSPHILYPGSLAVSSNYLYILSSTVFAPHYLSPVNQASGSTITQLSFIPDALTKHPVSGPLPPSNPKVDLSQIPGYNGSTCKYSAHHVYIVTSLCTAQQLQALNSAQESEGIIPVVLPTNWNSLTIPEQLFVLVDLERVDRGLPPYLGINAALSAATVKPALLNQDPTVAPGFHIAINSNGWYALGGVWAGAYSPLDSVFGWFYSDGWGGSRAATFNFDCTSAKSLGCWGHRDELLGSSPHNHATVGLRCTTCELGVGYTPTPHSFSWGSYVVLLERPAHNAPPMVFTWARNVLPFLPPGTF